MENSVDLKRFKGNYRVEFVNIENFKKVFDFIFTEEEIIKGIMQKGTF